VAEKKRGPAENPRAALSKGRKEELARAISKSSPRQLVFDFALWSSKAVVAYVRRKFHKTICRRTARRYLRELGFTCQCPVRRAREQNPAAI
jgi:transposase